MKVLAIVGDGTGHHNGMMNRLVAVAIEQHGLTGRSSVINIALLRWSAVGDVSLSRAEDLHETLSIGQRRARSRRREVAQTDRNTEVGAESHRAILVAESLQEKRTAEGVAGVMTGRAKRAASST